MPKTILQSEMRLLSPGYDRVGLAFELANEPNKIFRLIHQPYQEFFRHHFEKGTFTPLFERGLVQTVISPKYVGEQGELILEHEKIDISFGYEWSREMLKDAALFLLELTELAVRQGVFIKDSHYFNITFHNQRPVFFDFGSVVENKQQFGQVWVDHFFHNFVFPLRYFEKFDGHRYRQFVVTHLEKPFNASRFFRWTVLRHPGLAVRTLIRWQLFLFKRRLVKTNAGQLALLAELQRYVKAIPISYPKTKWRDYYLNLQQSAKDPASWDQKTKTLAELVGPLEAETLLDLAGNSGFFSTVSLQCSGTLQSASLTDYDEPAVDFAYRNGGLRGTYVIDFKRLDRDVEVHWRGKNDRLTVYQNFASRCSADVVLMLALIHHLTHFQGVTFGEIARIVSHCAKKWAIIEFVSADDYHVQKWYKTKKAEPKPWYTKQSLIDALSQYFTIEAVQPIGREREDRYLLLCKKK